MASSNTNSFLFTLHVNEDGVIFDDDGFLFIYKHEKTIHDSDREIVYAQNRNGQSMQIQSACLSMEFQRMICNRMNVPVTPENTVKAMFKSAN
jgi:hypothetical protein